MGEVQTHAVQATPCSDDAAPGDAPRLDVGTRIGRYVVADILGTGGMGVVYVARDPDLDRPVAIKLLRGNHREQTEVARARLRREARTLARTSDPNIVEVYDVGMFGGRVFVAMEVVAGRTLREYTLGDRPPFADVLATLLLAGSGIAAAHRAGVVHRDIKPGNILVADDGRVKVVDFGLARPPGAVVSEDIGVLLSGAEVSRDSATVTEAGVVIGTPAYMAPEQFRASEADARSDQYAYCTTAYEALYGARPFPGTAFRALAASKHVGRIPPPPRGSKVPRHIHRALERGLDPDPAARYRTMDDLLDALRTDPRPKRRAFVLVGGVAALSVSVSVPSLVRSATPCDPEATWASAWGSVPRDAAQQAFLASGMPSRDAAWSRVSASLDDYGVAWSTAYATACADRSDPDRAHGADVVMLCLSRARRSVQTLASMLAEGDDRVLARAVAATDALVPPSECTADAGTRADTLAGPRRARADALRADLASARAVLDAGWFEAALQQTTALEIQARDLADEATLAEALALHGRALAESGDTERAVARLEEAQFAAESIGDDRMLASIMAELIYLRGQVMRDFARALALQGHALAAADRLPDPDGVRGRILNGLGNAHEARGDYEAARACYEEARERLRRSDGETSAVVARSLNNLGNVSFRAGDIDDAHRFFSDAHRIWAAALGEGHPDVAMPLLNLAVIELERGHLAAGDEILRRVLVNWEIAYGKDHAKLATPINNLSIVNRMLSRYDEALAFDRRNIEISTAAYGPNSDYLSRALQGLGITLRNLGRYEEAATALQQALAIREADLGPDHEKVSAIWTELAKTQSHLPGGADLAARSAQRAVVIDEGAWGADTLRAAPAYYALAVVLNRAGRHREAIAAAQRTLAAREGIDLDTEDFAAPTWEIAIGLEGLGAPRSKVEPAALRARDLYRRGEHQREAQDVDVWLAERYSRVPP